VAQVLWIKGIIMRDYIEQACEEIDAAMFSGDAFIEEEERNKLREYIGRWERKMKEWEEIEAEVKKDVSPCWGNCMNGITPERGAWVVREYYNEPPKRIL
jgi:hypothetical protein